MSKQPRQPMGIYDDLVRPDSLAGKDIWQAMTLSVRKILMADQSRWEFNESVFDLGRPDLLAPGHLMDHRVRPTRGLIAVVDEASLPDALRQVLGHMLQASNHPGARSMVADALRLDPERDAIRLMEARAAHRAFFERCMRGRLGSAIRLIPVDGWDGFARSQALNVVAMLLVYYSCMTVQLMAARSRWIDHLPFQPGGRGKLYNRNNAVRDLAWTIGTIKDISDYVQRRRPRYPNSKRVTDLLPQAAEWQAGMGLSDDEVRAALKPFFGSIDEAIDAALPKARAFERATKMKKRKGDNDDLGGAKPTNPTLHRALFGATAPEALVFAVMRLVQLADRASETVALVAADDTPKPLSIDRIWFPTIGDPRVAQILYVYRTITLGDERGRVGRHKIDGMADVREAFEEHAAIGTAAGQDLINHASPLFTSNLNFVRAPVGRGRLTAGQMLDLLPEHWLQVPVGKVQTPPQMQGGLLRLKQLAHEEHVRNRPPNRWRASGKDRTRSKRPRK